MQSRFFLEREVSFEGAEGVGIRFTRLVKILARREFLVTRGVIRASSRLSSMQNNRFLIAE